MATPGQMAKKAAKQTSDILTAIEALVVMVVELKTKEPDTIELTAELDETLDRTDEILAAINGAAMLDGKAAERCLHAIGLVANEMINLKADIAELKAEIAPPPATARRTKK